MQWSSDWDKSLSLVEFRWVSMATGFWYAWAVQGTASQEVVCKLQRQAMASPGELMDRLDRPQEATEQSTFSAGNGIGERT